MTSNLWLVAGVVAFVLLILFLGLVTAVINRLHPDRSRGKRHYSARNDNWRDRVRRDGGREYDEEREERRSSDAYRRREEREYGEHAGHRHHHPER